MRFWIKKENDQDPHVDWKDAYVFSVNRDTGSTLYSSLPTVWYHLNQMVLNPLYEDLYIIISVSPDASLMIVGPEIFLSLSLFWNMTPGKRLSQTGIKC